MTILSPVMGIAPSAGSPVFADLHDIVELRRERLLDGGDMLDLRRGDPDQCDVGQSDVGAETGGATQAWQRLARQRLGIGTALIDLDNALAYAVDVGPRITLYRVIVARSQPRHLDLAALFASGEVAAARFAANGIVEWVPIPGADDVTETRSHALRQGATPMGRVFALTSLPAEGGLRLIAQGGEPLTLDLVPPSVSGRHYPQARRFAWNESDAPMSYGFGAPAAEQMPGGLAALFAMPWH